LEEDIELPILEGLVVVLISSDIESIGRGDHVAKIPLRHVINIGNFEI
jgi:hypothetical protein